MHPASLYVGLRSEQYFVDKGTPLKIELIVTDLDGNAVGDRPIEVRAARMTWKYQGGKWQEVEADAQDCTVGSQDEPVSCTFDTPQGGEYRITARVTDEQGRTNESSFTRWVSGGQLPPNRQVTQEELTLIPDKESYQPGDTARILVQSPFSPAEGLLTVSRSGVLYTQTFQIEDGSTTLEVPIESTQIPNLNLQVDLVGQTARLDEQGEPIAGAPLRPAFAGGTLSLRIPPLERTLTVEVSPQPAELEPGGETTIELLVSGADGKPAADAELALVVVDEAILALTGYSLPDPLGIFYTDRPSGLESFYGRSSILLASPELLADGRGGGQADVMSEEAMFAAPAEMPAAMATQTLGEAARGISQPEAIQVRADFNPLAAFEPVVTTDAQGKASVTIQLPDNLTRYRIMAVAVDAGGKRFGQGEASLTARLPLMVRPSAPRFLNFGDQFELPVVLQNQTDEAMQVSVAVSFANLKLLGNAGLLVEVPAHDRVEVRFPAAADMAGTASIQIVATAGEYADAITIQLPVYTPATTEAFATYGVIDSGAIAQPLLPPEDVFPQFGGLEIQTSSTSLQALTDAVLYLVSYPFDCSEQIASRLLAIAGLRDVLSAFQAEGLPSPEEMEASIDQDITRLEALQNTDGGFPYWRKGDESIPFNTIHVAHALARALNKGYQVPPEMLNSTLAYLREIESHFPVWYSLETRRTLSAYALYARDLLGDPDPGKAQRLITEAGLDNLSLDAIGWLWPVLLDTPGAQNTLEEMRRIVNNRVVETASAANFTNSYDDQNYLLLGSDRRTDAILLDALIQDDPDADLIPKLVNGLLAHSVNGRWGSTQENVFVLVALDRYFNTYESVEPDFVARMWLGEGYVGEHAYQGYSTDYTQTVVPMSYLVDQQPETITLEKQGDGRLYYRLGLRYAPESLQLDPLEMGFVVQRRYEAVDIPTDVTQDENGVWHIKAGVRVRVRLTMVADTRRYHVALADPLPAGLEILNPSLAVTGSIPQDPSSPDYRYGWWWWGTWYNHQNMRDERAEAFTPLLWEGVYTYTYVTRATTPGTFIVPPAKAEEMYSPEVFGRTGTDVVVVK